MAGESQPAADRLRGLLRDLKPGARSSLISELERGLLRGDGPAGAEVVLAELRRSLRGGNARTHRFGDPARMFLRPLEPFLVDDGPEHKHRGRIARSALEPIWLWFSNTLLPEEAKTYSEQVEQALLSDDADKVEQLARAFQDRAVRRLQQLMEAFAKDDKERRRLSVQLGTPHAFEDVRAVLAILNAREGLAMIGTQLPGHINSLSGPLLERVTALIDTPPGAKSDLFLYSLVLLMSRLAAPWQLIRLATKAAGGDDTSRIAETPYAVAVSIVLDEVDRRVRELSGDLKSGRGVAVSALLKEIHDALRGLRSELDLPLESAWGKQLTAVRAETSKILTAEIELMSGRVRRLMRPRPSKDIAPGSRLDPDEVADAEALIGFVVTCRNYAGELAINEVTQRVFNELQQSLDSGTHALLDALRHANDRERAFRQSQVDAAVRFCAKVFGQEYASLIAKAADVASQSERKAADTASQNERKAGRG
jgi:hypothetical protein